MEEGLWVKLMLPSNSGAHQEQVLVCPNTTFSEFLSCLRFVSAFKVAGNNNFKVLLQFFVIFVIVFAFPTHFRGLLQPLGIGHTFVHGLQCKLHRTTTIFFSSVVSFFLKDGMHLKEINKAQKRRKTL